MKFGGLSRLLTISWLVVGIPVTLAVYRLLQQTNPLLCYLALSLLMFRTVISPKWSPFAGRRARPYWVLFAVLFGATIPVAVVDRTLFGEQMLGLMTCLIWSSVAISLAATIRTQGDFRRAVRALDVLGVAMVASVLLGGLAASNLGFEFGETIKVYGLFRVFGPLGDQVAFAIVPVTVAALLRGRIALSVACVTALLLTGTRGALVALVIAVLWALVTARQWFPGLPRRQRRRIRLMAALAGGCLVASFAFSGFVSDQLSNPSRGTFADRQDPLALGIELAADRPVLGFGFLGSRPYLEAAASSGQFDLGAADQRNTYATPNQLVQTATDAGLPGLLALTWFVMSTLWCLVEVRRKVPPELRLWIVVLEAGFVGLVIGNQSAVWLLPTAPAGYLAFVFTALAWRSRELFIDVGRTSPAAPPSVPTAID